MANLKCKVCGTEFPALRERHYVSREGTKTCVVQLITYNPEPALFDSYDCPNCGCQINVQGRNRRYTDPPVEAGDCGCCRECCEDEDDCDDE